MINKRRHQILEILGGRLTSRRRWANGKAECSNWICSTSSGTVHWCGLFDFQYTDDGSGGAVYCCRPASVDTASAVSLIAVGLHS
jgi:hypothetical protein